MNHSRCEISMAMKYICDIIGGIDICSVIGKTK